MFAKELGPQKQVEICRILKQLPRLFKESTVSKSS